MQPAMETVCPSVRAPVRRTHLRRSGRPGAGTTITSGSADKTFCSACWRQSVEVLDPAFK